MRLGKETLGSCEYVQAQAEKMPFPDASFDAITCVYLLHELPPRRGARLRRRRRGCSGQGAS